MIIAQTKKKENIAEYVLYMFQIEDIIRGNEFDIEKISDRIISRFQSGEDLKKAMKNWYSYLISEMKKDGLQESGHINEVNEVMGELNSLHLQLLQDQSDSTYLELYRSARKDIEYLKERSGVLSCSDMEASFNGLYGLLVLRLQQKEVSAETKAGIESITKLLARLSSIYMNTEK